MTKNEAALETVNSIISDLKAFNITHENGIGHGIKGQHCARAINALERMAGEIEHEIHMGKEW